MEWYRKDSSKYTEGTLKHDKMERARHYLVRLKHNEHTWGSSHANNWNGSYHNRRQYMLIFSELANWLTNSESSRGKV